ncbi:cardiolipin synthase [Mucilaginibacter sp.]|jgi:cardiolipin synthase|uniref:cardiolipin synthase n=1 Tax=Mucilaginibacter sp. TaxID=1882438 RepID=UPI002CA8E03E|nr:cardiolipin synthase [Mucilaginibacter sp.]HTI57523.1 cardiolipin synthase [Mucilaginibacter sp.]
MAQHLSNLTELVDWVLIGAVIYIIIVVAVCLRIIYDTRSNDKAVAYLLVTVFLPVIGIAIYFSFGISYRKEKLYNKKIVTDKSARERLREQVRLESEKAWDTNEPAIQKHKKLALYLLNDGMSPLTGGNQVKLLINGENKFPEVLECIKNAKHHIHIQYYIFEDGNIGEEIKNALVLKAREGVDVRFIYDDFGSRSIRRELVDELKDAGVQAYPFYKVHFILLANRVNYRNHRKIIIIDGCVGFTGGINVSDRYVNKPGQLFWRDTHVKIAGPGVYYLQYLFICDWNFCSGKRLKLEKDFFCTQPVTGGKATVQIAASGPDSDFPSLMFSMAQTIGLAEKELLITTPYFIPGSNIMDALHVAAMSGVKIKILVPDKSDSGLVNAAARSYYGELLDAGVEIYMYQKGFVHAKTMVSDGQLCIVGTANMDHRSFELNFEVNSMIYDTATAEELRNVFYDDIKDAKKINPATWKRRPFMRQFPEKVARLLSPLF